MELQCCLKHLQVKGREPPDLSLWSRCGSAQVRRLGGKATPSDPSPGVAADKVGVIVSDLPVAPVPVSATSDAVEQGAPTR